MSLNQYIKIWTNFFSKGSKEEADYFIENIATLLDAGIPFTSALAAISKDIKSPRVKIKISRIFESVKGGEPFWKALEREKLVSDYAIPIIKFGEYSGKLVESLYAVAKYQQKQRVFRSRLISAISYPGLILFITVIVGTFVAWFILPNLKNVFSSLDLELPWITKVLLALGDILSKYGWFVVPLFLASFIAGIYFVFIFPATRHIGQGILFALPLTKKVVQEVEIARFTEGFGMLLEAGSPPITSFDSVAGSTTFRLYSRLYAHVMRIFQDGGTLKSGFESYPDIEKLYPSSVTQIISAGEQSGKLSYNLLRIGARYEDKLEITIKNLPMVLEPILLFLVWGGVMVVAIAVILPLYQLVGQL